MQLLLVSTEPHDDVITVTLLKKSCTGSCITLFENIPNSFLSTDLFTDLSYSTNKNILVNIIIVNDTNPRCIKKEKVLVGIVPI